MEKVTWVWRQRMEWCSRKPRKPGATSKGKEGPSPRAFSRSMALLTSWSGTSSLYNCKIISILNHQICGHLLWSPQETNTSIIRKTTQSCDSITCYSFCLVWMTTCVSQMLTNDSLGDMFKLWTCPFYSIKEYFKTNLKTGRLHLQVQIFGFIYV